LISLVSSRLCGKLARLLSLSPCIAGGQTAGFAMKDFLDNFAAVIGAATLTILKSSEKR